MLDIGFGIAPHAGHRPGIRDMFPGADWAADFEEGAYFANGAALTLNAVVSDTRASPIVLADPEGWLTTLPAATPARTGRGLHVYGPATPLVSASDEFSTWSLQNGATIIPNAALGADGAVSAARVTGASGQSSSALYTSLPSVTARRIKKVFRVKADTADKLNFGLYQSGPGWFAQTSRIRSGPGVVSGTHLQLLTGLRTDAFTEVEVSLNDAQSGIVKIYIYPDGATVSDGKSILLDFVQATSWPAEPIINPDLQTSGTLMVREACRPHLVPGSGGTPFEGYDPSNPLLTFAVEWEGAPVATGVSKHLLYLQKAADHGMSRANRVALYLSEPSSSLTLAVYDEGGTFQGGANAGNGVNDGGRHRALGLIDHSTRSLTLAVDGQPPVSLTAAAFASPFGVAGLGHDYLAQSANHLNGVITRAAFASGNRLASWMG